MRDPRRRRARRPHSSGGATDTARLFFALWPDAIARAQLGRWGADLQRTCGGRRVRDAQLHVTLAFLGDVSVERLPELRALAESLVGPGFTLRFDVPGYWPRRRLVWAAPAMIPDGLTVLAGSLARVLEAAGFRTEDRPYFPHATLLRDARDLVLPALGGFEWRVRDFVLVESELESNGSTYRVVGRWPLAAGESAPVADTENR